MCSDSLPFPTGGLSSISIASAAFSGVGAVMDSFIGAIVDSFIGAVVDSAGAVVDSMIGVASAWSLGVFVFPSGFPS